MISSHNVHMEFTGTVEINLGLPEGPWRTHFQLHSTPQEECKENSNLYRKIQKQRQQFPPTVGKEWFMNNCAAQKDEAMSLEEDWVNEIAWKLEIAAFKINQLPYWEEGYSFHCRDLVHWARHLWVVLLHPHTGRGELQSSLALCPHMLCCTRDMFSPKL